MKKPFFFVFILFSAIAFSGCATRQTFTKVAVPEDEMKAFLADKPDTLKPAYVRLLEDGKRNAVLNNMRLGLDAYHLEHRDFAIKAFDDVLLSLNTLYADNEAAHKARKLWYEEGAKDFMGEPYERAMAYFYRGLLFLEDGDFENARAAFKSGILQDAFAEEEQHRCDFASLIFFEGWSSKVLNDGDLAGVAFDEVKKLRPDFHFDPNNNNVLILVETGTSPRKVADGPGHSELKYRRGRHFSEVGVDMKLDTIEEEMYPIEDVFWQAASRGGRGPRLPPG